MKNTNLEKLSVVELKDLIKKDAKENGKDLPLGMWKMNKAKLITELKNISENEVAEAELIEEEIKELVEELVEVIIEEKVVVKPKKKAGKLIYLTLPTGEEIEINGMGKYHQYFKDNHPELKSWAILGAAVRGEDNEKTKIFSDAGFKVRMGEGYQFGQKNQYSK